MSFKAEAHIVTTHCAAMAAEGSRLLRLLDNYGRWTEEEQAIANQSWPLDPDGHQFSVEAVLDRAANLLRHAAEEATDERLRAHGWRN